MKEALSQTDIKFAYIDTTGSMLSLKQFLKFRDTMPEFAPIREAGRVGLPCLVVDGEKAYFGLPEDLDVLR